MKSKSLLTDFPANTANFLSKLSKNNNREWLEANRDKYNSDFLEPAVQFVLEMGDRLLDIDPEIIAIPKIDKSIFRLHRDVRFSKDKSPYKTNMGLYFWNSKAKKSEAAGFYFHVEPKLYGVAAGIYMPSAEILKRFRNAVSNPLTGKELHDIVKKMSHNKKYAVEGKKFKRLPKGYSSESPYSEYLLYEGIYSWYESKNINELTDGKCIDKVFRNYKDMSPLYKWLNKNLF